MFYKNPPSPRWSFGKAGQLSFLKGGSNKRAGFALIETLLYIFLFSIIISGAVVSAYQIVESSDKISARAAIEQEGSFLIRKIDWAMTGADNVSASGGELVISSPDTFRFRLNGDDVQISRDGGANYINLNNDAVAVTTLNFLHITETDRPDKIMASTTVSARASNQTIEQVFETTKYLRK